MTATQLLYPQPGHHSKEANIESPVYFDFEADFVEDNVRCIPMVVRFKLDACGIKLKLSEWSKMRVNERNVLAEANCADSNGILQYRKHLQKIILMRTGAEATDLAVEKNPGWANLDMLPEELAEKLSEFNWCIPLKQWRMLTDLQRFVLLKLCRPGHENQNFPKAMGEFGLL